MTERRPRARDSDYHPQVDEEDSLGQGRTGSGVGSCLGTPELRIDWTTVGRDRVFGGRITAEESLWGVIITMGIAGSRASHPRDTGHRVADAALLLPVGRGGKQHPLLGTLQQRRRLPSDHVGALPARPRRPDLLLGPLPPRLRGSDSLPVCAGRGRLPSRGATESA